MDLKIIFSIIATVIGTGGLFWYFRDIFLLKTKPHPYTWLIWTITQGTAAAGVWYGGGAWGAFNLTIWAVCAFVIFLLSLKWGTKNITKSDLILLIIAFAAILIWWQLNQPVLSILMVSAIDLIGYIPSFRKSFHEPWSESLISWFIFFISDVFAVLAIREYNILTTAYIVPVGLANVLLFMFCFYRRQFIKKPQSIKN